VLVVEGDEELRARIAASLAGHDFEVQFAEDGDHALATVSADERFDVIVFDLQTAAISAQAFVRRLRRGNAETPVILLSSHGASSMQREVHAEGVMRKPFEAHPFAQQLRSVIAGTSS
jgi:CheY-like chemotaxis protein